VASAAGVARMTGRACMPEIHAPSGLLGLACGGKGGNGPRVEDRAQSLFEVVSFFFF
jgi:hypothetical protein